MTAEPIAGPRHALIIATSRYRDRTLSQLRAPGLDATELANVLGDPAIGGFTITALRDLPAHDLTLQIQQYLMARQTDDVLVLYLSGHGLRDMRGRLYFAAANTSSTTLEATAVESRWLLERLEDCRARQQVVILDCCYSGAFAEGVKAAGDVDLAHLAAPGGRGRVVLTASRAHEYSFEGHVLPDAVLTGSVFTAGLVDGLRHGRADSDDDGLISVADAFDYAYRFVRTRQPLQTPQQWAYGVEGTIWLARAPIRTRPAEDTIAPAAAERTQAVQQQPSAPTGDCPSPTGTIVGWGGRNDSFVLAIASGVGFGQISVPAGITNAVAISAGTRHALALLADGTVRAWGDGTFGRTKVPRGLANAAGIAAGGSHSLAVRHDGTLVGWGNNSGGQARTPKRLRDVTAVAAGGWHSLALHHDGTVSAWGENGHGQAAVPPGLRGVVAIAAGEQHSLALCRDGRVIAWGRGGFEEATVPAEAITVTAIAAGGQQSLALRADGSVVAWGRTTPHKQLASVAQIACGDRHCLALTRDGQLVAWGDNEYGQCMPPRRLRRISAIAAGGLFSLALVAADI